MLDYCKNTYSDCSNGLTKHKWKKCTLTHTLTHRDTDTDRQTGTHLSTKHITTIRHKLPWTVCKRNLVG